METRAGWVQMSPAQATVMMLEFSMSPQVTMTGGVGARRALPFQVCLAILGVPFGWDLLDLLHYSILWEGCQALQGEKAAEGGPCGALGGVFYAFNQKCAPIAGLTSL